MGCRKDRDHFEDVIVDLKEIGWDDMEWINLAQDTGRWWDVCMVMNLQIP